MLRSLFNVAVLNDTSLFVGLGLIVKSLPNVTPPPAEMFYAVLVF